MRPLKLLLVEDSRADTELVMVELARGGFEASMLRVDTEAGLRDALQRESWELVLCDHGLPSFSSTEALRTTSEAAGDVPFVILSGTIGEEAAVEALRAGARDVVLKTNLGRLAPVVDRVLLDAENRRQQARLARERDELELRLLRANEELRESERQYRLLFESNPQPMAVYDRDTLEIVTVNDQFVTNYGYTRRELLAMSISELGPEEDVALLLAALPTNPDGVKPADMGGIEGRAWRHIYKDGTVIEIEATSANLTMGTRACRIALFHNVTERNRAFSQLAIARDEAVEASNMKSAFLANVSHEVRTPMNGVIGMTELLLDTELSDEQREYASQVWRSGEQMLAIVNDILDLSKIEGGHLELEIADFDLRHVIEDVCAGAAAQARAKGLGLTLHIDDLVPHRCIGDGRRLGQVLLNLTSNAIKFTAAGSIDVRAEATPASDERLRIRVEVTDSGIGIATDALERMFEPFMQADVSTTRHYGGSGLGLAIAREILEMMGGVIGVHSEPGQGSSFWFEVELAIPDAAEEPPTPPAPGVGESAWTRRPLLLVAEDSAVNQIVAARALERCGCRTHVVSDGREAVEAFATGTYDAVLLDCQMPNVDGYQATAGIRLIEKGTRRTPIIAMTANAMEGEYRRCLDAGMDDHISKPMRHAELAEKLLRWIPADVEAVGAEQPVAGESALASDAAR